MRRLIASVLLVSLLTAGCGTVAGVDWGDAWTNAEGGKAPFEVIHSTLGAAHCDWESIVLLYVRWPGEPGRMMYVRDPDRKIDAEHFETSFQPSVPLPHGARFSGYRRDDVELWASRTTFEREIYLVFPDHVERWPRSDPEFGCA